MAYQQSHSILDDKLNKTLGEIYHSMSNVRVLWVYTKRIRRVLFDVDIFFILWLQKFNFRGRFSLLYPSLGDWEVYYSLQMCKVDRKIAERCGGSPPDLANWWGRNLNTWKSQCSIPACIILALFFYLIGFTQHLRFPITLIFCHLMCKMFSWLALHVVRTCMCVSHVHLRYLVWHKSFCLFLPFTLQPCTELGREEKEDLDNGLVSMDYKKTTRCTFSKNHLYLIKSEKWGSSLSN